MDKQTLIHDLLTACRTELCQLYPGLNLAFAWLPYGASYEIPFGTDGIRLYASEAILPIYAASPAALRRGLLHVLLHCLYLHIFPPRGVDPTLWGLACDVLVERQITALSQPRLETEVPIRTQVLAQLPEGEQSPYEMMEYIQKLPYPKEELTEAFRFDDHRLWWEVRSPELIQKWQSARSGSGAFRQGTRGTSTDGEWVEFTLLKPEPRDYRPYLRKYMVPGEEMELDEESFDYIYYDLGMRQYGNLPLLEPLEYREVTRLDELVIAIDTSSSCDEETVSRFLREAYAILTAQENFFRRMNVIFFQCDCCLLDMARIRSREEWLDYAWNVKIHGRGGTDFRPVFREIERLRKEGVLKKPRALLYFTDGDGAYPSQPPDYETVFILAGKTIHPELLPPWAVIKEVL